jgi:shikimate kinase
MSGNSNVYLVGPMGVGKTTIGKHLAEELQFSFLDTDQEIESRTGADIPWIFDVEGEEGFRERESRILEELSSLSGLVLATGGGIVLREQNRKLLHDGGRVVYLTAPLEKLVERTRNDRKRPLLQGKDPGEVLRQALEVRDPLYRDVADIVFTANRKTPRQAAKEIAQLVRGR